MRVSKVVVTTVPTIRVVDSVVVVKNDFKASVEHVEIERNFTVVRHVVSKPDGRIDLLEVSV